MNSKSWVGMEFIHAEEVLRVAKTYLHPENYILVIVGDLKEAGME